MSPITRQDLQAELRRRKYDADAMVIYRALRWGVSAPDWFKPCDGRVMALYLRAHDISEKNAQPVVPQHLRDQGPNHAGAVRIAEIYQRVTDSAVIDCNFFCLLISQLRMKIDTEAREAWQRRCVGLDYPQSELQSAETAKDDARRLWNMIEELAMRREKPLAARWTNEIKAVTLDAGHLRPTQI